LRTEEEAWLTKLNLLVVPLTCFPKKTSCWQLQFSPQEFKSWLNTQKSHVLCFDGASKGNPGEAGAGGVLFSPRGQRLLTYSWNLGMTTNNSAEAYALLKGAQIAKVRQINELIILGDSKTIIRYFIKITNPKNSIMKRIIDRTRDTLSSMLPTFYHVRRANNGSADEQANRAIGRSTGHLEVLGRTEFLAPP
jgi:ribonuclease HI